jgi:hypothetical protein
MGGMDPCDCPGLAAPLRAEPARRILGLMCAHAHPSTPTHLHTHTHTHTHTHGTPQDDPMLAVKEAVAATNEYAEFWKDKKPINA